MGPIRGPRLVRIDCAVSRLDQRRGCGVRDVDALPAMIYLCLGGITIALPA
jgi:hypothetical protein